jgi:hypothetical protein
MEHYGATHYGATHYAYAYAYYVLQVETQQLLCTCQQPLRTQAGGHVLRVQVVAAAQQRRAKGQHIGRRYP